AGAGVRVAVLAQPQRGLDREAVERVDDPGRTREIDVAVLDLRLLRRIGDPLDRNEDLHVDSLAERPRSTSWITQSAARTISNFFGRVPPPNGAFASTHASASSSRTPKIMRAPMCAGTAPSMPAAATMPASMRRKSASSTLSYSFMNLLDWRSSI